ncbi:DUF1127 domain-containing protein [Yoonia sp.]|uniref:DUF1127 domain-containing protein n=1 Tax=Yoonia sp. TaxID=2212373 RepID=UPI003FCEA21C
MAMAVFETTRPAAGLSLGRISGFFVSAFGAVAAWNDARVTRNSLSKLSARELDDIGLSAGDIDNISERLSR